MSQEKIQGGAMGGVEELYREVILDHFKAPKNRGTVENPTAQADGMNPLCGDQLSMTVLIKGPELVDIRFEGHGCAISQSAASMLTAVVKSRSLEDVRDLALAFKQMFGIHDESEPKQTRFHGDDLGDLVSLEGVKKYPVRIKCAVLSANTLLQALKNVQEKRGAV